MKKNLIFLFLFIPNLIFSEDIDILSKYNLLSKTIECEVICGETNSKRKSILMIIENEDFINVKFESLDSNIFSIDLKKQEIFILEDDLENKILVLPFKSKIQSIEEFSLNNLDYGDYYYYLSENKSYKTEVKLKFAKKSDHFYIYFNFIIQCKDYFGNFVEGLESNYMILYKVKN